jgi:S-adenosylmethionine-diacylglycerol 3-amino-3-carboxypropyl transferase
MPDSIAQRARFDRIRYANCWEDANLLVAAFSPLGPAVPGGSAPLEGRRILSIASGGDNSFALLAAGAAVTAADLSPAQLALVELKRAALRRMAREEFLAFLGLAPGGHAAEAYRALRAELPSAARGFWDANPAALAAGLAHAGKFERFFGLFRRTVLPLIHRRAAVAELLAEKPLEARRAFYERRWNNRRWRLLFRLFFSRAVLGRLGRDPEFFRYVEGSVADRILARARYALTELPTHSNPYLRYILCGTFAPAWPPYLQPNAYEAVRDGLDRLTLHLGPIEEAARESSEPFDGFNLSDIFEYLDPPACTALYGSLLERARPGARLAYWNMLVPRTCPAGLQDRVSSRDAEAATLFARDRAFFYSRFVVEEFKP